MKAILYIMVSCQSVSMHGLVVQQTRQEALILVETIFPIIQVLMKLKHLSCNSKIEK